MRTIVEEVNELTRFYVFRIGYFDSFLFDLDSPGEQNISIVLNGIESELQFVKMGIENQVSLSAQVVD